MLQINNDSTLNNLNMLNRVGQRRSGAIQQIATGSRLNSAANNAAAYAIIQATYGNIGAETQSIQNTQNSGAMLRTAQGGTENIVSNLTSLRETLINAANGTNSDNDLRYLQQSAEQTIASINDTAASTTYNGKQLLQSDSVNVVAGNKSYDNVEIRSLSSESLGLTDSQGRMQLDFSSPQGISKSLELVDSALNSAIDQSTTIGAEQQGLVMRENNQVTMAAGLTGQAMTMDSTDMAKAATNFRSADLQQQLALYATNLNNHNRGAVLSLLR